MGSALRRGPCHPPHSAIENPKSKIQNRKSPPGVTIYVTAPRYDRSSHGSRVGWLQWQRRVMFRSDGNDLRRGTDARVDPACSGTDPADRFGSAATGVAQRPDPGPGT